MIDLFFITTIKIKINRVFNQKMKYIILRIFNVYMLNLKSLIDNFFNDMIEFFIKNPKIYSLFILFIFHKLIKIFIFKLMDLS